MKIEEFKSLSLFQKIKTLYVDGEFVTSIRYYRYKVNLFLLHDYLIEAFYHPKTDRIEKIIPYDNQHTRRKFYTDQVKLHNLFEKVSK